jgi:hypothetical protein
MVIGCPASSIAPYETELAQSYNLVTNYTAVGHPSPPDYVALISGSTHNMSSECFPTQPCGSDHLCCPINGTNIVDRFDFSDIYNNKTRCARLVSAETVWSGNTTGNPDIFLNDLGSTATASNFMWLSPSSCDQWHHLCAGSGTSSQGEVYLSSVVPKILSSTLFTTQRAALFVVYDEGFGKGSDTCPSGRGDCVYAVWAGPQVKRGYVCNTRYSHYSFLATLELNWGLQNLTSNDGSANPMTQLFTKGPPCGLQAGFTHTTSTPKDNQTLGFSGLVSGGVQPYSFAWDFGDRNAGAGQNTSHTFQNAGSYTVTLTVTDAIGQKVTAVHPLTVVPTLSTSTQPTEDNHPTSLLLVGVPVVLTFVVVFAMFLRRRRRKASLELD